MQATRFTAGVIVGGIWAAACFLPVPARAQVATNTYNFSVSLAIPDNDSSGVSDSHTILPGVQSITDVRVTLNITGGFNGDYYAYLTHDTGFAVLLNRAGLTGTDAFGYADSGLNVTFDDTASNGEIHLYRLTLNPNGGALTGTWAPDGRDIHPADSLDTTLRSAFLSSFDGLNADGDWTLFVADVSAVGGGLLNSWELEVVGVVPEPGTWSLFGMGAAVLVLAAKRRRRQRSASS
jgi:subtilisin-like proprotein convertase family protein